MLIALRAEGAECNSPAQRAGSAKQGQLSAESAPCDRLCAKVALDESGILNIVGRAVSATNNMRTQTWAVGPGFYIQRFQRFENRPNLIESAI